MGHSEFEIVLFLKHQLKRLILFCTKTTREIRTIPFFNFQKSVWFWKWLLQWLIVLREAIVTVAVGEENLEGQNLMRVLNTRWKSLCVEMDMTLFYTWLSLRFQRINILLFLFMIYSLTSPSFLVHLKSILYVAFL